MQALLKKQDMANSEKLELDSENRENSIDVKKVEPSEVWEPGLLTKTLAFILFDLGIWFLIGLIYVVFFWDFGEAW